MVLSLAELAGLRIGFGSPVLSTLLATFPEKLPSGDGPRHVGALRSRHPLSRPPSFALSKALARGWHPTSLSATCFRCPSTGLTIGSSNADEKASETTAREACNIKCISNSARAISQTRTATFTYVDAWRSNRPLLWLAEFGNGWFKYSLKRLMQEEIALIR